MQEVTKFIKVAANKSKVATKATKDRAQLHLVLEAKVDSTTKSSQRNHSLNFCITTCNKNYILYCMK